MPGADLGPFPAAWGPATEWGQLDDWQIRALMRARVPRATLHRAMGVPLDALVLNPRRQNNGRKNAMARRRRNPEQLSLSTGEISTGRRPPAAHHSYASGPFHGPYAGESHVKMGRRARGRGRAKVYGPVKSASAYRARKRPKKATHHRRRKARRGPQSLAAARRMPKALRAYWIAKLGGRSRKGRHTGRARKRGPGKKAMRRFVRSIGRKAKLIVYPGLRRGQRIPRGRRLKTRTYSNPRRRRNPMATYTNPRRRRRRHNPGFAGGAVATMIGGGLPGAVGGAAAALIDSTVLTKSSILVRVGSKVVLAALGGALLRRNPVRAAGLVGGLMGTAAYTGVLKATGGVVSGNRVSGMQELAAMAAEDEASLGLLQQELQGMGLLEEQAAGIGEAPEPELGDPAEYEGMGEEPSLGDYDE
jgi:hypothetical protein